MSLRSLALVALAALTASFLAPSPQVTASSPPAFDDLFTRRTMRVDYFHTGSDGRETVALDRLVSDGPWPGSLTRLVDETNLGTYFFEVIDAATNRAIYSRGFASLFGEWETTDEAPKGIARTFHESIRFPWPRSPVQLVLKKRDRENVFREVWSTRIDPDSRFVNAADRAPLGTVWTLFENGPASAKVDLLIIGDGYTRAELPKFHADAQRLVDRLFATEPFRSRRADFNVRAIDLPVAESGVHRPQAGVSRRTALSTEYNIFDSERYALVTDNRMLREVACAAPYEFLEILINDAHYGGGGIFNAQATAAVDTAFAEYIFVHEFGHHFAALGDEYYTSDVAYETGRADLPEPWEPNITALHDAAKLKWRDLVDPATPIPTPWDKAAFEAHSREIQARRREIRARNAPEREMNALLTEQQTFETKLLGSMTYSRRVGAFEGAAYEAKGLYRPEADCIMFSRDDVGFCRVCRRAISRVIDLYSRD